MEGNGWRAADLDECGRKQVLAGVLLDVIETPLAIDHSAYGGTGPERFGGVVPDFAVLVLFDAGDFRRQFDPAAGGGHENAGIVRLAAAGGVKR